MIMPKLPKWLVSLLSPNIMVKGSELSTPEHLVKSFVKSELQRLVSLVGDINSPSFGRFIHTKDVRHLHLIASTYKI